MNYRLLIAAAAAIAAGSLHASDPLSGVKGVTPMEAPASTAEEALGLSIPAYRYTAPDGFSMAFRFYAPPLAMNARAPLVIYFHATGQGGDDNLAQIPSPETGLVFLTGQNRTRYPCYVLIPQAPGKEKWSWGPLSRKKDPGDYVTELVRELVKRNPGIDSRRIYLTGFSMGGFASLRLVMEYPDLYAAAVPVAGAAGKDEFRNLRRVPPVWLFFNQDDDFHIQWFRESEEALRKMGTWHRVTVYPEGGHSGTWKAYQEPDLLPWLFRQRR